MAIGDGFYYRVCVVIISKVQKEFSVLTQEIIKPCEWLAFKRRPLEIAQTVVKLIHSAKNRGLISTV